MPLVLTNAQIDNWITKMHEVVGQYTYGRLNPRARTCNCWQAIMTAARRAGIGYVMGAVGMSGRVNPAGDNALAAYVFAHRTGIMFSSPLRNTRGIPSGVIPRGHIIVWGRGAHVALSTGQHQALEFDRNDQGERSVNAIDARYRSFFVMWAPPPTHIELQAFANATSGWNTDAFGDDRQVALMG